MKNTILALVLASSLAGASSAMADVNIGTVNMKFIFANYYKTKDADAKMNEERNSFKQELDERTEAIKVLEADITRDREELKKPEVSEAKKIQIQKVQEKKVADWQEKMKERQSYLENTGKQIETKIVRIRNTIVEEITAEVNAKVKAEGYDLVFDTSGFSVNNVPVVMYAKDSYDFTKAIVDKLNAGKSSSSPVSDDAAPSALDLNSGLKPTSTVPTVPAVPATPVPAPKKKP